MRKGLTPVIAMILLLMMTVAAAGASFYWLLGLQGELQGGTQQFQEQTFERMTSDLQWMSATFERNGASDDNGTLMLTVMNTGTTKIPVNNVSTSPNVMWTLYDSEQDFICTSDWSFSTNDVICQSGCVSEIGLKEVRTINLTVDGLGSCSLNSTTIYPDDTLIYADISFSGKTTASGTFRVDTDD